MIENVIARPATSLVNTASVEIAIQTVWSNAELVAYIIVVGMCRIILSSDYGIE